MQIQSNVQKYNIRMWVPKAGVSLELSCRHYKVTAEQKDLCEEETSSSSATEEEIKRNCTVYLHELIQTSMKPAASRERTKESNESTGQNNVQINTHEKL